MKITFNLQNVGLANNGGSATIVGSANVLASLGHEVFLVSNKENLFTWSSLNGVTYIKTEGLSHQYPDANALIATGVHSVPQVLNAPPSKGSKFWWVRAHEAWSLNEAMLFKYYKNYYLQILVNSLGLRYFIASKCKGISPPLVRPGIDLEVFYAEKPRKWAEKKKFVLGGLYCEKPRKRFYWIVEIFEACKARGLPVELHLFGTYDKPKGLGQKKYCKKPNIDKLRAFYNGVDIWLAPTKSEGLHMPPQEAMLCECIVIGAEEPLSGMMDYLKDGTTGFTMSHWSDAVSKIEELFNCRTVLSGIAEAARQKILELGDRKVNMERMVAYLKAGKTTSDIAARVTALRRRGVLNENFNHRL